jgi:hypothetical protein
MFKKGYYYLHTNSQIKYESPYIIKNDPQFFNKPHIVKYWKVENSSDYKKMIIEAKEQGA